MKKTTELRTVSMEINSSERIDKVAAAKADFVKVSAEKLAFGVALHELDYIEMIGFEEADKQVKVAIAFQFKDLLKKVYAEGADIKPFGATNVVEYATILNHFETYQKAGYTPEQICEEAGMMSGKMKEFWAAQKCFKELDVTEKINVGYNFVKNPENRVSLEDMPELKRASAELFGIKAVAGSTYTINVEGIQMPLHAQHISGYYSVKLVEKTIAQILYARGGSRPDLNRFRWAESLKSDIDNEKDAIALEKQIREMATALKNEVEMGIR